MKFTSHVPPNDAETGVTPDFNIYTGAMEVDPEQENIVRMVGSSTERDLQGDTMALSALTDMAAVQAGQVTWLNHRYQLPSSLFGSLTKSPTLTLENGIADIHIVSDVESSNPDALQTYGYVKRGRRLGCSVGCMVLEFEIDEENDEGHSWWPPIIILHVLVLEFSIVGIPANQRCWVEPAMKGLFERSLSEGKGDQARSLAPAVKGLYPRAFQDKLKSLDNDALRRDLERVEVRAAPKQRVEWVPNEKTFVMNRKGIYTPVGRDEVSALLTKGIETPRQGKPLEHIDVPAITKELPEENIDSFPSEPEDEGAGDDMAVEPEKEMGVQITTPFVNATATSTINPLITIAKQEELEAVMTAPLEIQLYNAWALKSGQPQLALDEAGQIIAVKSEPALSSEEIQDILLKALEIIKGGNEFSKQNRETLQQLHNDLTTMCRSSFDPCKEMANSDPDNDSDSTNDTDEDGDGKSLQEVMSKAFPLAQIEQLPDKIDALLFAFKDVDIEEIKDLKKQADLLQRQFKELTGKANATREDIGRLRSLPLGRPTGLTRSVRSGDDTVSYDDFTGLTTKELPMNDNERKWTLEEALKNTTITLKQVGSDAIRYRHWPEGVGGSVKSGVRPQLTGDQRSMMRPPQAVAYADGLESDVVCYDDPGGVAP